MDKKLTDSEIPNVKELLKYKVKAHCELCDLKKLDCCNSCIYTAIKQFIELFNRLQAENERLKLEIESVDELINPLPFKSNFDKAIETAKAEAYKECIEKVKAKSKKTEIVCSGALVTTSYAISNKNLDNLLKKLVGEQ